MTSVVVTRSGDVIADVNTAVTPTAVLTGETAAAVTGAVTDSVAVSGVASGESGDS
jgi:hypothetical protein